MKFGEGKGREGKRGKACIDSYSSTLHPITFCINQQTFLFSFLFGS